MRFFHEPRAGECVAGKGGRDDFERELFAERGVPGAIHLSHPAFAKLLVDDVAASDACLRRCRCDHGIDVTDALMSV
jgi:hypothetical protein